MSPSPAKQEELATPLTAGVPGFVAQLKNSGKYNEDFKPIFSMYLSNETKTKGKVTFGGYNLAKYAKKGAKDQDVTWAD